MIVQIKTFSHNYAATNNKGEIKYFITNKSCAFILAIKEKLGYVFHCKKIVTAM
jgi:hypothetical protein